ncbi:MAG: polyphosphate polymerase domain-containing protein [Planctomycetes bacterium]|nr:polyphosphate polymerase domain-containing protein [Planctomycetota bacterium]
MSVPPRYELKFLVDHEQRSRFLEAARVGLIPDPHGENAVYRVTSLYFDTPALDAYWEKLDGLGIRSKLRLRYYGEPASPSALADSQACYLEIKRRIYACVRKDRVRLSAQGAEAILTDPERAREIREHVLPSDRDAPLLVEIERRTSVPLPGTALVTYRREAWVGEVDPRLRITFDLALRAHQPDAPFGVGPATGLPLLETGLCVMEIKFDRVIPIWVRDLVYSCGLRPQRYSKYAASIDALTTLPGRLRSNALALEQGPGFPLANSDD